MHIPRAHGLLLVLVAALAVTLGFWSFQPKTAVMVFKFTGYGLTLIALLWFGYHFVRILRFKEAGHAFVSGGWKVAVVIAVLTTFIHVQERHGFKVVMDEVALLSTSKRMHDHRESAMVLRGYYFGTNFVALQGDPDKRPLLFPVMASLLHDFTGYRIENVFWLNGLLTPALLLLIYLIARRVSGHEAGLVAMVLFVTVPLLTQTATGGGFELLNLVMILLTIYTGMRYVQEVSRDSLAAFCLSGVLLAQVRYESALFVLPVAVVILWTWWRMKRVDIPWALIASPLLLLGYRLQQKILDVSPMLWQLSDRPSDHGVFSVAYFYDNIGKALNYFLSWDLTKGNSHLLFIAGAIGVGFFWMKLYREYRATFRDDPERSVFIIFMLGLFALSGLLLCYFWGAFDDVLTTRLSLPVQLFMLLAFVWVWPSLVSHAARWKSVGVLCVLYLLMWTVPNLQKRAYAHTNLAAEQVNWLKHYMDTELPENSFVLDSRSTMIWLAGNVPATTLEVLALRRKEFLYHYHRHTFDHYFLVERMEPTDFETGGWKPFLTDAKFTESVKTEQVKQLVLNPIYAVSISRIVAIEEEKFEAWGSEVDAKRKAGAEKTAKTETATPGPKAANTDEAAEAYIDDWLKNLP